MLSFYKHNVRIWKRCILCQFRNFHWKYFHNGVAFFLVNYLLAVYVSFDVAHIWKLLSAIHQFRGIPFCDNTFTSIRTHEQAFIISLSKHMTRMNHIHKRTSCIIAIVVGLYLFTWKACMQSYPFWGIPCHG